MSDYLPGIHHEIPFTEYAAIPALNNGILRYGQPPKGSMKHLKSAMAGEMDTDDTKDRKFGRAVHIRLLEPERYAKEVKVAQVCHEFTKPKRKADEPKRCSNMGKYLLNGKWLCGTHAPKDAESPENYITAEEWLRIEHMAETVHESEDVKRILRAKGWSEVTVLWEYQGHLLKARLDRMSEDIKTIVDVKSAGVGCVGEAAIEKSVADYGFHRQAAMYVDGVEAITGEIYNFAWVFIEKEPPYDIGMMRASEEVLDIGRYEYRQIIDNWDYANKKGIFNGTNEIPRRIETVKDLTSGGLPGWYLQQFANIDTGGSYQFAGSDFEGGE